MNLLQFLRDAGHILCFRYKKAQEYHYDLTVFIGVVIAMSVTHAAIAMPMLGRSVEMALFLMICSIARWLILTRSMTVILQYFHLSRISFLGYTLITEALSIRIQHPPLPRTSSNVHRKRTRQSATRKQTQQTTSTSR